MLTCWSISFTFQTNTVWKLPHPHAQWCFYIDVLWSVCQRKQTVWIHRPQLWEIRDLWKPCISKFGHFSSSENKDSQVKLNKPFKNQFNDLKNEWSDSWKQLAMNDAKLKHIYTYIYIIKGYIYIYKVCDLSSQSRDDTWARLLMKTEMQTVPKVKIQLSCLKRYFIVTVASSCPPSSHLSTACCQCSE